MAASRSRWLVALAGLAMLGAGCGSSGIPARTGASSTATADRTAVGVIRAWSTALRRGDVAGAARYFALPSEFVNGPGDVITIQTEAQALAANATLPCGAVLISTERHGRFVSALFRLTNRLGSQAGCGSGTGQLARTDFVISKGHIVEWIRAPTTPGGGGSPAPSTTPSGPVV